MITYLFNKFTFVAVRHSVQLSSITSEDPAKTTQQKDGTVRTRISQISALYFDQIYREGPYRQVNVKRPSYDIPALSYEDK